MVQKTRQYLATNLFSLGQSDWDIVTYKYDTLTSQLENVEEMERAREEMLAEVNYKIQQLINQQMSDSGTMPKQETLQKIFRDLIMQKQNEILNQTNIDKRKQ